MFRQFSIWELLVVLLIILLIFGPSKLPQLGRAIGKTLREFRQSMSGSSEQPEDEETARPEEDGS